MSSKSESANSRPYKVRESLNNTKTQLASYSKLENAKKKADENPGYKVYDSRTGLCTYNPPYSGHHTENIVVKERSVKIVSLISLIRKLFKKR